MPNREEINVCAETLALATQSGATTAQTSAALDVQGYDTAHFGIAIGTTIGSAVAYKITECDTSGGSYTDVAAAQMVGAGLTAAANSTIRVAYVGTKRYIKCVVTPTGATDITITAHRGMPSTMPPANPAV
jgi:hypothetical protein